MLAHPPTRAGFPHDQTEGPLVAVTEVAVPGDVDADIGVREG